MFTARRMWGCLCLNRKWQRTKLPIFFKGGQKDYFRLYETTARTIKDIDPQLRVGGPSTSALPLGREIQGLLQSKRCPP